MIVLLLYIVPLTAFSVAEVGSPGWHLRPFLSHFPLLVYRKKNIFLSLLLWTVWSAVSPKYSLYFRSLLRQILLL